MNKKLKYLNLRIIRITWLYKLLEEKLIIHDSDTSEANPSYKLNPRRFVLLDGVIVRGEDDLNK